MLSKTKMVVSPRSLKVLASSTGAFKMFGYHPHEIIGRNILDLTGARSDLQMFQNAIVAMQGQKMQLILYGCSGVELRLIVACSPFFDECIPFGCLLTLHHSEAITLADTLTVCPRARALVSVDTPNVIHMANDDFIAHLKSTRSQVLGQPLLLFFNDIICSVTYFSFQGCVDSDEHNALRFLLAGILTGCVARLPPVVEECGAVTSQILCEPVVEALNGPIRHFLLTIEPVPCHESVSKSVQEGSVANHPCYLAAQESSTPISADSPDVSSGHDLCMTGSVVFPRRKPQPDGARLPGPATPVVISMELIRALAGLSIQQAAAAAGVSVTSFKQACRRLGIRRWAYRRHRPACSAESAAGRAKPVALACEARCTGGVAGGARNSARPGGTGPACIAEAETELVFGADGELAPRDMNWASPQDSEGGSLSPATPASPRGAGEAGGWGPEWWDDPWAGPPGGDAAALAGVATLGCAALAAVCDSDSSDSDLLAPLPSDPLFPASLVCAGRDAAAAAEPGDDPCASGGPGCAANAAKSGTAGGFAAGTWPESCPCQWECAGPGPVPNVGPTCAGRMGLETPAVDGAVARGGLRVSWTTC